jgi:Trypsin-like peptidase domain
MGVTLSNRVVTVMAIALVTVATAAGAAAGAARAAGAPGAARAPGAPGYWTQARMAAAVPAGPAAAAAAGSPWRTGNTAGLGLRWTHGGAVTRSVGKVFFTLGKTDYVCSGTAVDSPRADVVLTAAHCVSDGAGRWATNWVFVPGYRDGAEPYGTYPARRFFVPPGWPGSEQYDVAFVQVSRATLPAGLPVAFQPRPAAPAQAYVFGYPSLAPYTGLYVNYCAGPAQQASGGSARIACGMTAGDSGGPWFAGFRPGTGTGTIVAVSTYKLAGDMHVLYGAMLGPAAQASYQQASVSPVR